MGSWHSQVYVRDTTSLLSCTFIPPFLLATALILFDVQGHFKKLGALFAEDGLAPL